MSQYLMSLHLPLLCSYPGKEIPQQTRFTSCVAWGTLPNPSELTHSAIIKHLVWVRFVGDKGEQNSASSLHGPISW